MTVQVHVTKHAIRRYRERIRDCSDEIALEQIYGLYMSATLTDSLSRGDRFYQCGDVRIVKDPLNRISTLYVIKEMR